MHACMSFHFQFIFIPFHHITLTMLHYLTLRYGIVHNSTVQCIALNYITLNYIACHCIALDCIALHYIPYTTHTHTRMIYARIILITITVCTFVHRWHVWHILGHFGSWSSMEDVSTGVSCESSEGPHAGCGIGLPKSTKFIEGRTNGDRFNLSHASKILRPQDQQAIWGPRLHLILQILGSFLFQ